MKNYISYLKNVFSGLLASNKNKLIELQHPSVTSFMNSREGFLSNVVDTAVAQPTIQAWNKISKHLGNI